MDDNPYYSDLHAAWFFYDECGDTMGPYPAYKEALKWYNRYCRYLEGKLTLWDKVVLRMNGLTA